MYKMKYLRTRIAHGYCLYFLRYKLVSSNIGPVTESTAYEPTVHEYKWAKKVYNQNNYSLSLSLFFSMLWDKPRIWVG